MEFLKQLRIFNPARVLFLSHGLKDYDAVPGMEDISAHELATYVKIASEIVALT